MKKLHRLLAAAVAIVMTLLPCDGWAAAEPQFTYYGIKEPTNFYHNLDKSYRHNEAGTKAVHYYGWNRSPQKYTDDLFPQGYNYMCYGTGKYTEEYSWNALQLQFPKPNGLAAGDVIYFSFYYRSAKTFDGADGSGTYIGQETLPSLRFNNKNTAMYELSSGIISGKEGTSPFLPDGNWHKAEYYVSVSSDAVASDTVAYWICFMQMQYKCSIDLAGFSYGVLKTGDVEPSNEAYYTLLGWELNRASLDSLTVDGKNIALTKGVTEYTADADAINATINAFGGEISPLIEKKDDFTYEITAYAVGYGTKVDEEMKYTQCISSDGNFDKNGTKEVYATFKNDRKTVYTLLLNVKPVKAGLSVNGIDNKNLGNCADGDIVKIDETYNNFTERDRTFITLLVFYKDGRLFRIVPYKAELKSSQQVLLMSYTYELDLGDYSDVTCDIMIMDADSYNETLK